MEPTTGTETEAGFCLECTDTPATVKCESCDEQLCDLCYQALHRKGARAVHKVTPLNQRRGLKRALPEQQQVFDPTEGTRTPPPLLPTDAGFIGPPLPPGFVHTPYPVPQQQLDHEQHLPSAGGVPSSPNAIPAAPQPVAGAPLNGNDSVHQAHMEGSAGAPSAAELASLSRVARRAPVTPLRLDEDERAFLKVLLGALNVSQYTELVDVVSFGGRAETANRELRRMCHLTEGLAVAAGDGERSRSSVLRRAFEAGRRYKVMNPDRMRSEYGMMLAMLQDAAQQQTRGYNIGGVADTLCTPLRTVASLLARRGNHSLLQDPDVVRATRTIVPWHYQTADMPMDWLQQETLAKAEARARVIARHATHTPPAVHSRETSQDTSNGHHHHQHGKHHNGHHTSHHGDASYPDSHSHHGQRAVTATGLTVAEVERILDSIADADAYCALNARPVRRMIQFLQERFNPDARYQKGAPGPSGDWTNFLHITSGVQSSRLSHSHNEQWHYVMQSLVLWLEIVEHMLEFWSSAEADMLKGSPPSLRNTGQGLHRVQAAERVGDLVQECIKRVTSRPYPLFATSSGSANGTTLQHHNGVQAAEHSWHTWQSRWIGSCVVHLGDHCVPSALIFIDKYTQVPRILGPIVACIDFLESLARLDAGEEHCSSNVEGDRRSLEYVKRVFGSPYAAQQRILCNFFRHAFDGSGANNSFDAGSCIDGRLTSCWNWCSRIEKKTFYRLFMLSGFVGFDGSFAR